MGGRGSAVPRTRGERKCRDVDDPRTLFIASHRTDRRDKADRQTDLLASQPSLPVPQSSATAPLDLLPWAIAVAIPSTVSLAPYSATFSGYEVVLHVIACRSIISLRRS